MINLFDSANFPNSEPGALTVGALWGWKRSDVSQIYSPDSYTLKYFFYQKSQTATRFNVTANKVNGEFVVEVASTTTIGYAPGDYIYTVVIERDSDNSQVNIGQGILKIKPALNTDNGDLRTHNEIVLDAICATIEKSATKEQQSYQVAGRSLSRRSLEELHKLKKTYTEAVNNEKRKALRKQGKKANRFVPVILDGR